MADEIRRTLTVDEAAPILGVNPITLYRLIERQECPIPTLRIGKRILFPIDALERVLSGETSATEAKIDAS